MISSGSLYARLRALVWDTPLDGKPAMPIWQAALIEAGRIAWVVGRDLIEGRLNLRAMSLVYTTLLALVPALAIAFAIFRAFGFDSYVQDMLTQFLGPLGEQGGEITKRVMEFVQRVNANVLGTVGFAFLLYTVVSMINKIEEAFNNIWHVQAARSFTRQFTEVISMGVLGPIVVLTALGIMAGALSHSFIGGLANLEPIRFVISQMNRLVPYVLLIGTFTFLYAIIPNTRVQFLSALVGATVAGVVWGATGWAFATFVVKSAQYVAIYSAFAGLVVFMIWLYAAWLILLTGCAIAFYFQNRRHLSAAIGLAMLTPRQRNRMAVHALLLVHEAFEKGRAPWTEAALARHLHLPLEGLLEIVHALQLGGFITLSTEKPCRLLPNRPAEMVKLAEVLAAVRRLAEPGSIADRALAREPRVDALFDRLAAQESEVLDGSTIASLLAEGQPDAGGEGAASEAIPAAARREPPR
jgi:membrane protein